MAPEQESAGDPLPDKCEVIEVRVAELRQLFNAMDPSPFREKDLDPNAEEFIVAWARESSHSLPLALLVHVDRPAGPIDEAGALREAVNEFFRHRAKMSRRRLRQLFSLGRTSLIIGLTFLGGCIAAGDLLASAFAGNRLAAVLREGVLIGGWVAMWRPIEIFLYEWWPIRAEARLYDRLAVMPARLMYLPKAPREAWRSDWPAVRNRERDYRR